ncbi:ThiF family adenylyltransferase [Microvirga arabica]|uniref:ThiF family adenylyltransferase n=1 Tax=Microvirga arabica TaxID=1128671 RepID=A0ABV6YE20_9HYPH
MPDRLGEINADGWMAAAAQIEALLTELTGHRPEALDAEALDAYRPRRQVTTGWRIPMNFPDGVTRRLDVLVHVLAPHSPALIALVDRPPFYTWPHVERDGVLCLLPNESEVDSENPAEAARNMLGKGTRLVESLLQGDIVDRDFKDEFLTYWAYDINHQAALSSLIAPRGPTREIRLWRGRSFKLIGESDDAVCAWLNNRFNERLKPKDLKTEAALLMWLDEPPLPSEYPYKASDMRELAERAGGNALELLERVASSCPDEIVVVIGADARHGPGLISVTVRPPNSGKGNRQRGGPTIGQGYRKGKVPIEVAVQRYFGPEPVFRSSVNRADAPWVHGRGQDPRSDRLLGATATVIGCGSVGAPVAIALAQAGVGTINLVDPEKLEWANVGRHPLGATSVGDNKATELSIRIRSEFPHLTVRAFDELAQSLLVQDSDLLRADVVIAATGSWAAEASLNDWHVKTGRKNSFLYGWTETHACAGHAVAIAQEGGDLRAGIGGTGVPAFRVTSWPEGGAAKEEPACGAHYHPYGPIELGYVNATIADLALDALLGKITSSTHRVWVARRSHLDNVGGHLTPDGALLVKGHEASGLVTERPWPMPHSDATMVEAA